jgi:methylmalonyl-CoA mutase
LFQGIEASGGAAAALVSGVIQRAVEGVRKEREANVARGAEPLIGTSIFSNPDELPVAVLNAARPAPSPLPASAARMEPLAPIRLGEPFE